MSKRNTIYVVKARRYFYGEEESYILKAFYFKESAFSYIEKQMNEFIQNTQLDTSELIEDILISNWYVILHFKYLLPCRTYHNSICWNIHEVTVE